MSVALLSNEINLYYTMVLKFPKKVMAFYWQDISTRTELNPSHPLGPQVFRGKSKGKPISPYPTYSAVSHYLLRTSPVMCPTYAGTQLSRGLCAHVCEIKVKGYSEECGARPQRWVRSDLVDFPFEIRVSFLPRKFKLRKLERTWPVAQECISDIVWDEHFLMLWKVVKRWCSLKDDQNNGLPGKQLTLVSLPFFFAVTGHQHSNHHGRHQEEDASHEAWEGQCHGQGRRLRAAGQGRQPQGREGRTDHRWLPKLFWNIAKLLSFGWWQ